MDLASALRVFVRTVERGSLTAAARDLAISQPAVTKHLRNLERHVGARLLERTPRLARPTAQGLALYEASRSALATIDSALEGVRRDMGAIEGTLRIHAPICIGARHLHPIVMAFQARHPSVAVDLLLENRQVDLIHEGIDLALRYGRPDEQGLIMRRLGWVRRIVVASPRFLDRVGPIEAPEQLSRIAIVTTPSAVAPRDVLVLQREGKAIDISVRPILRTNAAEAIVASLVAGHAAGPVQQLLVARELAEGSLVRILPEYEVRPTEAYLTYPSLRFMRPVVRAFTDFAVDALRDVEGLDGG